jgi:hypothetical protein
MLTYGKVHHHDNALPHTAAFTFQLGVVWPSSLQPWSRSERLPPIYLPEVLVGITALRK